MVLTHDLWKSVFASDPALVGETIEIDGRKATVVGVMPQGFNLATEPVDSFAPVAIDPANRQNRGSHFLYLVGRLAPKWNRSGPRGARDPSRGLAGQGPSRS